MTDEQKVQMVQQLISDMSVTTEQISEYLEYYELKKGYMISFNFNKKKEIGVKDIVVGDKLLVEAVV